MSLMDTNKVIKEYLDNNAGLIALVGDRIYCPSAPENAVLPYVTFNTRGGRTNPYIPDIPSPSKQFDCWADDPIKARAVYLKLYDALQGIQRVKVTLGMVDYYILGAREEVHGQDLQDVDIPGRFKVLTFFEIMIR